jgi:hypothetical protein
MSNKLPVVISLVRKRSNGNSCRSVDFPVQVLYRQIFCVHEVFLERAIAMGLRIFG